MDAQLNDLSRVPLWPVSTPGNKSATVDENQDWERRFPFADYSRRRSRDIESQALRIALRKLSVRERVLEEKVLVVASMKVAYGKRADGRRRALAKYDNTARDRQPRVETHFCPVHSP